MDAQTYLNIQKQAESLKTQKDRMGGQLVQLKTQIEKEFGVRTTKLLEKKIKELKKEDDSAKAKAEKAKAEVEKKWGDRL